MAMSRMAAALLLSIASSPEIEAQVARLSGPALAATDLRGTVLAGMRLSLEHLVTAQERFFAENARYGRDMSDVDETAVLVRPAPGVTLTLVTVTERSWTGTVTHSLLPGVSCVVFMGDVAGELRPRSAAQALVPPGEGDIVCDP